MSLAGKSGSSTICCVLVKNREDAMDLAQDVFLKAYQNLRKLEDPVEFAPWLYRIAHNEAYSLLRKNRPETDLEDAQHEPWMEPGPTLPDAAHRGEPGSGARATRLSSEQREAVVLKIYQGFKFEEMADILGCPVSTVKSRLYTALDLLKIR